VFQGFGCIRHIQPIIISRQNPPASPSTATNDIENRHLALKGIYHNWSINSLTDGIPLGARRQGDRRDSDWPIFLVNQYYGFSKQTAGKYHGVGGVKTLLEGELPTLGKFKTAMLLAAIEKVLGKVNGGAGDAPGAGGNDLQVRSSGVPEDHNANDYDRRYTTNENRTWNESLSDTFDLEVRAA
jgi:hypothetical protein